ncbi:MAG: hypothetical protein IKW53_07500 [Clostridia bacterium]|nr:hypothetical protein [Clostridia bacterium]
MANIADVKTDRMRFTKNKISANLSYVAILFNALYFISIYTSDVRDYYYNIEIGFSVIYNLLFMLFVFLSSEGVKSYDKKFSIFLTVLGALQIVRIFKLPLTAYYTFIEIKKNQYLHVMESDQFFLCVAYLSISAICAIIGGVIGIIKSKKLSDYEKTLVQE